MRITARHVFFLTLLAVHVFVGLADLWLAENYGKEGTVTAEIRELSRRHPVLPMAAGVLMGHLFWGE